jgi:hypothetical protein
MPCSGHWSVSGRLGLPQSELRIMSQVFINKFTTVAGALVSLDCTVWSYTTEVTLRSRVSRPVSLGVRTQSWTHDQFLFLLDIFFRQLRVCYFVAPSLTRGRVCNLLLLLILASAVTLGLPSLTRGQVCLLLSFCWYQSVVCQYVHKTFTLPVFDTVQGYIYNIYIYIYIYI